MEVIVGAYTLLRGMNASHWGAAIGLPHTVTRDAIGQFFQRGFLRDESRQDLNVCVIRLDSNVGDGLLPLARGDVSIILDIRDFDSSYSSQGMQK